MKMVLNVIEVDGKVKFALGAAGFVAAKKGRRERDSKHTSLC